MADEIFQKFQNLTANELEQANNWFNRLRAPEKPRLEETLRGINSTAFKLTSEKPESMHDLVAVIVSGTSIDRNDYSDIDLFVLPEYSPEDCSGKMRRGAPATVFGMQINKKLPKYVYPIRYGGEEEFDLRHREGLVPQDLIDCGLGAVITVTLFYELNNFKESRQGRPDDLIEPVEPRLGAEEIIEFNRERNAKFLVLSRQYKPT